MPRKLKLFLAILALISIIASLSIIFELDPFNNKEKLQEEGLRKDDVHEVEMVRGAVVDKQKDFFILSPEDDTEPIKVEFLENTPLLSSPDFEEDKELWDKFNSGEIPVDDLIQKVTYESLKIGDSVQVIFDLNNGIKNVRQISIFN
jgi:hypothetical protein